MHHKLPNKKAAPLSPAFLISQIQDLFGLKQEKSKIMKVKMRPFDVPVKQANLISTKN